MAFPKNSAPIRLMMVDDSAIIRTLLARFFKDDDGIEVVGSASNGQEAIDKASQLQPDIILLDVEMPVMDGLTAIPLILQEAKFAKIILCSALSEKGADVTLKGLAAGASDFILKPSSLTGDDNKDKFRTDLFEKIFSLHNGRRFTTDSAVHALPAESKFQLKPMPLFSRKYEIIGIGSSTGGPNALIDFFKKIRRPEAPIVITQHMPRMFTKIFADQLAKAGCIPCHEATDGQEILPGHAYVAPGDYHMLLSVGQDQKVFARLSSAPPENFCRPAVDPMLRSMVNIYGPSILVMIFTGMGADGLEGCREVIKAGGVVLAQDEESSAVWGMPGAVAKAGLCSDVANVAILADRFHSIMNMR